MTAVLREFLDADAAFKATGPVDDRAGLLAVVCAHSTAASKIAPALRALLFEVEGLRVDAERYRWLRSNGSAKITQGAGYIKVQLPEEFNAAIDAGRA